MTYRAISIPSYSVSQFFSMKKNYCAIIPIINEGVRIQKELAELKKYSKLIDIVLVDGGSTDGSLSKKTLIAHKVKAVIISSTGQSIQFQAGFDWALRKKYAGIITLDGNNKDDVAAIPAFIKKLDAGYDYVQGSRFIKGGHHENSPIDRIFFNRWVISPLLSLAAGHWYTDTPNNFRAYSRKYLLHSGVKPFRSCFKRYELLFYLTTRANTLGMKTTEIPVTRTYPKGKVPTKIVGWKRIHDLFNILKISLGYYNPEPTIKQR